MTTTQTFTASPYSWNVRKSDDCPSGTATAVRMGRSRRVHLPYGAFHQSSIIGHMPACGSGMGNPSSPIVPTDDVVTCPSCLRGEVL